jgi:hypothetical protein
MHATQVLARVNLMCFACRVGAYTAGRTHGGCQKAGMLLLEFHQNRLHDSLHLLFPTASFSSLTRDLGSPQVIVTMSGRACVHVMRNIPRAHTRTRARTHCPQVIMANDWMVSLCELHRIFHTHTHTHTHRNSENG